MNVFTHPLQYKIIVLVNVDVCFKQSLIINVQGDS